MPRMRAAASIESAPPSTPDDSSSTGTTNDTSTSTSTSTPTGVTFATLAPLIGFSFLLGVVADDVIIDFCSQVEWKKAYYAAHRTATFPTQAFVPLAIVVGFGGFLYNILLVSSSSNSKNTGSKTSVKSRDSIVISLSEEGISCTPDGSSKRRSSSRRKSAGNSSTKNVAICINSPTSHAPTAPSPRCLDKNIHPSSASTSTPALPIALRDWRVLLTIGLGLFMHVLFAQSLVPRQDFVAHVVVSDKSRLRSAGQVQEALRVIRQGHLLLGIALLGLVALQISLLAGGGRG